MERDCQKCKSTYKTSYQGRRPVCSACRKYFVQNSIWNINYNTIAMGGSTYATNITKSMGANAETVTSTSELEAAFLRAKKSNKTYVISLKTDGYEWLDGTAFWESPTLEVHSNKENKKAYIDFKEGKDKQRKGV